LTVTANANTICYGDEPAAAGVAYDGFAEGEDASVLAGTLAYAYNYAQYGDVGTYAITPSGLSGGNYEIEFVAGSLVVTQKVVGLSWGETSFTYDGTEKSPTVEIVGVVNGDDASVTVSGGASAAGTHTATAALAGTKSGNYSLPTVHTTDFTIAPATMTITVAGTKVETTYDGTAKTASGYAANSGSAFFDASKVVFTGTASTTETAAGTYAMGLAASQFGYDDANFADVTFDVADGELKIAKAAVTVTADAKSKVAGNADPALTATVEGKPAAGDEVAYTLARVAGEAPGPYDIAVTPGTNPNYDVTAVKGTFTITGAAATVFTVADGGATTNTVGYYATLADAVAAAMNGCTVALLANVNEAIVNTADKNFAIDLNGKTWSSDSDVLATSAGTITINATNGGTMTTEAAQCCAVWAKGGDVVINGGTFTSKDNEEATVYVSNADSVVTINGGTFENTDTRPYRWKTSLQALTLNVKNDLEGRHLVVNGGTFIGNDPQLGDDTAGGTSAQSSVAFVSPGYVAIDDGSGHFVVQPGWNVTFDANGGSPAPDAQRVAAGGTATEPTGVAKANHSLRAWRLNGADFDFDTVLSADIELVADWAIDQFDVIWIADGRQVASNRVDYGTVTSTLKPADPTKTGDGALYTFEGWGEIAETVTADATYTASFKTWTKVAVPAAVTGLVYDGTLQTGVAAGAGYAIADNTGVNASNYVATVTLADPANTVWADDTAAPTATTNVPVAWSIARAQATVTAVNASKIAGNPDPASFTATETGVVEGDTLDYTVARVAGEAVGSYDIEVTLGSNPNYDVTATKGTFTITGAAAAVITVAGDVATTNYSATVTAALEAAPGGATVVVLADTCERVYATVDNDVTLDINGHTMTSPVDDVIVKNGTGTLTIRDTAATPGLVKSTVNGVDLGVAVWARQGKVVVESGVFENNSNYEATLYVSNGAYAEVKGGTFRNVAEGEYNWQSGWAPVNLNVQNGHADKANAIVVSGGTFSADPMLGDDSLKGAGNFVDPAYCAPSVGGVFTVVPRIDIALATVTVADDLVYDGTARTGVVSVVYGTTNLVLGTDYVVTYADNVAAGTDTASAVLVGTNLWTGTVSTNFSIAQKPVTVKADNQLVVFGDPEAPLTVTVSGLVEGKSTNLLSWTASREPGNDVGTYAITVTGAASQGNYAVTFAGGTYTIAAAGTMTLYVAGYEGVYDGAAHSNAVQVVPAAGTTLRYSVDGGATWALAAPALTGVGRLDVLVQATNANFTAVSTNVVLAITNRPVVVTADSATKTYDGTALTNGTATATGLVAGHVLAGATVAGSRTDVGSSANVPSAAAIEDAAGADVTANYAIAYANGTLTVTPAAVTVTADAKSKVAGNADPALTATVEGKPAAGVEVAYTLARVEGEAPGTYDIEVTPGTNPNYDVTAVKGTFTITDAAAAVITVAGDVATTTYYATLTNAVAAAVHAGDVVKLLADVEVDNFLRIPATSDIVLDLNGHELTESASFPNLYPIIANFGSLVITNGTITTVAGIQNNGTLVLEEGQYNQVDRNDVQFVNMKGANSPTVTINGGTFNTLGPVVRTDTANSTINVHGGTLYTAAQAVIFTKGNAGKGGTTIVVDGGTLASTIPAGGLEAGYIATGIALNNDDTLTFGGTATLSVTNGVGILVRAGEVTVNGGVIESVGNVSGRGMGDSSTVVPSAAIVYDTASDYPGYAAGDAVTINAGTILSDTVPCVRQVADEGDVAAVLIPTTSTALFSDADAEGVPAGYALKETGAGTGLYSIAKTYVVVYENYDHAVLQVTTNFVDDATPAYAGDTPVKPADANGVYTFDAWSPATNATVTADATYTATYTTVAAKATVFTVADNGATTNTVGWYATLADAVAAATNGCTVLLLGDVTLDTRVEPNAGANTSIVIDLGGNTIARTGTSGNGSAFDVKSGNVLITNGVINCTQDDAAIAADGVYAITSRSGSNVTLADLAITVDSECGACAYPFAGSTMTIESGTYANVTTTPYRYNAAITGMAVNQPNNATQNLVIKGGSFSKYDPQLGDDSGAMTDFTADGYVAIADGSGNWVVQPGWNVTFDANGGSPTPDAQRVAAGGTATEPTGVAKANHSLRAWRLNGADFDFDTVLSADIELVADWAIDTFDVIWIADGRQVASNRVDWGTVTSTLKPADPTKTGDGALYTFEGWGEIAETVTADAIYTASFKTWTKVAVPAAVTGLVYDGTLQTGVAAGAGYAIADNTGVNASNYVA
ncbi:MAG: hypothetical protein II839_07550, partial [Kiritimatiellae bacterium]|nr:hypothetical protein [Kiritimatiellia bacterium]